MNYGLSKKHIRALILLRMLVGWHFLYEGVIKLYNPAWTSKTYLLSASGPFKGFFQWLAEDRIISIIDFLNVFGLMAVGLALVLGLWERLGAVGGIVLLLFYYLAQPPFPGIDQTGAEGNYFLVNKNLIEAAALFVLYYLPTGYYVGLARLFHKNEEHQKPLNQSP
ncbi:MAG: DoxX family protein [Bacteroidota bacterium]